MLVGYARVSTLEQNLDLQIDALQKAGCDKIFTEKMSSAKERPVFQQALEFICNDDTLIIWKLDRIGRSLIDLVHIVNGLRERGIGLQIITACFDTSTPEGELQFHFYAMLAQYERSKICERTMAGLTAARARGRTGGWPRKLNGKRPNWLQRCSRILKPALMMCARPSLTSPDEPSIAALKRPDRRHLSNPKRYSSHGPLVHQTAKARPCAQSAPLLPPRSAATSFWRLVRYPRMGEDRASRPNKG
jgi:hypothetical protein